LLLTLVAAQDGELDELAEEAQPARPVRLGADVEARATRIGLESRDDVELQAEVGLRPGPQATGTVGLDHRCARDAGSASRHVGRAGCIFGTADKLGRAHVWTPVTIRTHEPTS